MSERTKRLISTKDGAMEYAREVAHLDATEMICGLILEHNISSKELAERLGWSMRRLNRIINGSAGDSTLNELCDALFAFGVQMRFTYGPLATGSDL